MLNLWLASQVLIIQYKAIQWTYLCVVSHFVPPFGLPLGFMFCIEVALFAAVAIMMGLLSTTDLAAYQIAYQYLMIAIVIIIALTHTVTVRVGNEVGCNNREAIKLTTLVNICMGLGFMLMFNLVVLILGMFLDGITMLIVLVPLLLPVAIQMNIDPIAFGIIFLLGSAIGNITPPVGVVMYTVCNITEVKVKDFTLECLPFYIVMILNIILLTILPGIITFLPNLLF